MAHTPGPWDWEPEGDGENCASEPYVYAQNVDHRDGSQPIIALCYVPTSLENRYYGVDVDSEEVDNARLIAAAPELLEALEAVELLARDLLLKIDGGKSERNGCLPCEISQARAAIAKAKGEV